MAQLTHPDHDQVVTVPDRSAPALKRRGWIDLTASSPVDETDEDGPPPEKDALRSQAEGLGIEVNSRWGVPRLIKEIEAAQPAGDETAPEGASTTPNEGATS